MSHITVTDAKAWTEDTKLGDEFSALDGQLEAQIVTLIFARLSVRYSTDTWIDDSTTPELVKTLIAMYYVAFVYDRVFSTDDNLSEYAILLRQQADLNIEALVSGAIDLPDDEDPANNNPLFGSPAFYPTDQSSATPATSEDPSLGPAAFSMGTVF